jgi:hypothetical protein
VPRSDERAARTLPRMRRSNSRVATTPNSPGVDMTEGTSLATLRSPYGIDELNSNSRINATALVGSGSRPTEAVSSGVNAVQSVHRNVHS